MPTPRRRRPRASIDGVPGTASQLDPGVLIAAEGLDGSGKSAGLDGVARWLERKGRRVHLVTWRPSRVVARAAATPGGRQALTPRVAALLAASEAARRIAVEIERPLARGDVVLADRYVWTAVAREVARGLDPAWVASLYRFAPRSGPGPVPSPGARRRPGPGHRDAAVGGPRGGRRPGLRRVPRTTDGRVRGTAGGPAVRAVAGGRARHRPADRSGRPCRRDPRGHPADADGAHRRPPRGLGGVTAGDAANDARRPVTTIVTPSARPGSHGQPGVLFVLEGIDRSGRSTHLRRLDEHLRYAGHGVARTSLASSVLSGDLIRRAKRDREADPTETALLYAADLAERVEQVVMPALRAGLVVLADRYCWTPMARAEARGVDGGWLDGLFSFVPAPDAVLFLDVDAEASLARQSTIRIRTKRVSMSACRRTCGRATGCSPGVSTPVSTGMPGPAASPASVPPTRSSRSASACSGRRIRSWPRARTLDRVAEPASRCRHDPDRPSLRLPLRWLARAAARPALARGFAPLPASPTSSSSPGTCRRTAGRPSSMRSPSSWHGSARSRGSSSPAIATSSGRSGRPGTRDPAGRFGPRLLPGARAGADARVRRDRS